MQNTNNHFDFFLPGNTALHLAVMLGHKGRVMFTHTIDELIILTSFTFSECIHLLLAHNALVKIKNNLGWNPLAEAISYGDRQTSLYSNTMYWLQKHNKNIIFL